jgi:hypothetical protein
MMRHPASGSTLGCLSLGLALASALPSLGQQTPGLPIRPDSAASSPQPPDDSRVLERLERQLLDASSLIQDPAERSRELERAARAFLLSQNLDSALEAIRGAGQAALEIPQRGLRDVRLDAAAATALALAEQITQRGIIGARGPAEFGLLPDASGPTVRTDTERLDSLDRALDAFGLAETLATRIESENYRSAALARVVIALAKKSQDVARYLVESTGASPLIDQIDSPFRDRADRFLVTAQTALLRIPLPAFRDRTLVELVTLAAASHQYRRAREIAHNWPHLPSRAEALVVIAQAQAFDRLDADATTSYQDALETVTRIPLTGPRLTAAAILLDSLMACGRFEDARAAITIAPDPNLRLAALSAVARSMGSRGLVDAAYHWIDREAPPSFRDRLRREVADGLAEFVEQGQLRRSAVDLRGLR